MPDWDKINAMPPEYSDEENRTFQRRLDKVLEDNPNFPRPKEDVTP